MFRIVRVVRTPVLQLTIPLTAVERQIQINGLHLHGFVSQQTPMMKCRVKLAIAGLILYALTLNLTVIFMPMVDVVVDDIVETAFHWNWHPTNRRERFPSVEERIKLYMSSWYLPPCHNATVDVKGVDESDDEIPLVTVKAEGKIRVLPGIVKPDTEVLLQRDVVQDCARSIVRHHFDRIFGLSSNTDRRIILRRNMRSFCRDVMDLFEYMDTYATQKPLVALFGDGISNISFPLFGKWRWATSRKTVSEVTHVKCYDANVARPPLQPGSPLPPILWKLESNRHWDPLRAVWKLDSEWDKKIPKAIWRGGFTGEDNGETDLERCLSNQRCKFVYNHVNSDLVDNGFVNPQKGGIPSIINGTKITKKGMSQKDLLRYKIVVSFEGNDVASGLKWSLLSRSVVLMPPPTKTSWAMEELLEPWVHYIPMGPDGSNAEEMVQWVLDHDQEAERIAERATLFMYDLVFHPSANREEVYIKSEIVRRYRAHWQEL